MPLARATFNDIVLAESPTWETVEGNIYFPPTAIKDKSLFVPIDKVTYCPWKGDASYYSLVIGPTTIPGAAWYYPNPYDAASNIKDHVAFYTTESIKVTVE
ncbi:DUF427-domain-containing protein [Aspergillus piperis CBS 112811]|uniref:DUF427-domain-containing protein n=1 Tax=Aspergillus piperis CBS 112811 TaxID=1448313 RepID=A0A8G1R3F9_9EURO|nr:DUF427-domain-containing protein [Aspergillus piperis CBS 112811]RAH58749.1 DUF427-domain-containing protein [Aspergillus piperis CBS 112811]